MENTFTCNKTHDAQLQCAMWAISFIIGTAIPQVQTIQGLIGAACLLQFSYSLPPAMQLAFDIHADASKADGVYVPGQGPKRMDSWRSWSRWRRGLFGGRVWFKGINFVYFLAALATCGLGMWGSVGRLRLLNAVFRAESPDRNYQGDFRDRGGNLIWLRSPRVGTKYSTWPDMESIIV